MRCSNSFPLQVNVAVVDMKVDWVATAKALDSKSPLDGMDHVSGVTSLQLRKACGVLQQLPFSVGPEDIRQRDRHRVLWRRGRGPDRVRKAHRAPFPRLQVGGYSRGDIL